MRPMYEGTFLSDVAIKTVSDLLTLAGKGLTGDEEFDTGAAKTIAKTLRGDKRTAKDSYSFSSVASASSKLVAVFPVLTSRTVSRESANMVRKYIEQQGCMMLQLALQQANISNAKNGIEYLKIFHQNLGGGNGLDALGDVLNTYIDNNSDNSIKGFENAAANLSSTLYDAQVRKAITEALCSPINFESDNSIRLNAEQINGLLEAFKDAENFVVYDTKLNPVSIQDYMVKESVDGTTFHVSVRPLNELETFGKDADAEFDGYYEDIEDPNRKKFPTSYDYYKRNKELRKDKWEIEDRKRTIDERKRQDEERKRQDEERKRQAQERLKKYNVSFMRDQDIKKMNDATYSMLLVRFYSHDDSSVATEFIVGVKAKVVGCDSAEILRRIANDNTDGKFFINLMRTITGELKKSDFLFGLSRTYEDLESTKRKGAQGDLWALLKNRALASKEAVRNGKQNNYSAITTVVISRDDADDLYKEENLDITDIKVAKHFISSYNLLGLAICDDSTETLKLLLDDGSNTFDEYAYSMLERETQDGTYKKLINLIASNK